MLTGSSCLLVVVPLLQLISLAWASPVESRQSSPTPLSAAAVAALKPFTHYASTAYCKPATTMTWSCGANCDANPTFKPIASGGDGDDVQYWFVGYDPTLKTIIVSFQGTDTSQLLPILSDLNFFLTEPDEDLFPGLDSDIKIHSGFKESQADAAAQILGIVQPALTQYGTSKVAVVGHSLGAAIGLLSAIYLPLHLPSTAQVSFYGYGLPRVGNDEFASYVDSHVVNVVHVNNKRDPVPILPGRFLGFAHPSGEVHIVDSGAFVSCQGQDNTDDDCTIGYVGNIFEGDADDHSGPYDGVTMGC